MAATGREPDRTVPATSAPGPSARPLLVDEETAAALLSCSRRTIRRLVQHGALPRVFLTRRPTYRLSDLEALVDSVARAGGTGAAMGGGASTPPLPPAQPRRVGVPGALPSTWPHRTTPTGAAGGVASTRRLRAPRRAR